MQGYFQVDDRFIRQLSGVAMGGVLSSDVAGLVLVDLLNWAMPQLSFQPRIIKRYVDDLFLILPRTQVDDTLAIFNSYHVNLRFTCKYEVDGRLPFLDLLVIRESSGSISTNWYRKPSASDRCLDFRSVHAYSMKIACAKELVNRSLRLSSAQYREENKARVCEMRKWLPEVPCHQTDKRLVTRVHYVWVKKDRSTIRLG
ncbi:Retrotransposon protein [Nesidiocoris tenuis]|uniref:Retrotransposon protein n=1 Tax=Nesidiocoris tenuis TaxID=355587 RepID=A0ABN7AJ53_9HEMI|nr:Retrotransposon protein [Nesidiocoris tenuis]